MYFMEQEINRWVKLYKKTKNKMYLILLQKHYGFDLDFSIKDAGEPPQKYE